MNRMFQQDWQVLRKSLDYSYRPASDPEQFSVFKQQRGKVAGNLPVIAELPGRAHFGHMEWGVTVLKNCPELVSSQPDVAERFQTIDFLGSVVSVYASGDLPDERQHEIILLLQKRFEVNRRIFSEYDHEIRRIGEEYAVADLYALLALVLQMGYLAGGSFGLLNSSIKALDLLSISGWPASSPKMAALAFCLEGRIIGELLYGA